MARAVEPFVPAPNPAESFDIGTLHVDRFGAGTKPIVLIPGLASGAWVWYGTIEKFAPAYSIYVITLPGFDGRAPTNERPLFVSFRRDFWAILESRKIKNPVVIGHSLGGTLAFALAEEHPEKLAGVLAVDGLPVFPMAAYANPDGRKAMANQMAAMYADLSPEALLQAMKTFMASSGTNHSELIEPSGKLMSRSDAKAVAEWAREDVSTDLRPGLNKISIPVCEIVPYDPADGSPYTQEQTLAFYNSLLAGAPNAKVVAISPAKHFAMLDQAEKFYHVMGEFLTSAASK